MANYKGFGKMSKEYDKFITKNNMDADDVGTFTDTITDQRHIWNCIYNDRRFRIELDKNTQKVTSYFI